MSVQAEKGTDGTPALKWGSKAQDIYCVVMGRRQKWFSNQLACIMWVKPGTPVRTVPCATYTHTRAGARGSRHRADAPALAR